MPDSLIHTGDTDTMVRFGTDEVHLRTGGGAGLYVRNSEVEVYRVTTKLSNANAQLWVGEGDGASDIYMSKGDTGDEVRFSKNAAGDLDILTNSATLHIDEDGSGYYQGGNFTFNENSADVDFTVESNGNANMLFVDGGNDRVGIGTATPIGLVEINSSTTPELVFNDTGGGSDSKVFRLSGGGDKFFFEGRNDANSGDGHAPLLQTFDFK